MSRKKEIIENLNEDRVEFNEETYEKYKNMVAKLCRKAIQENPSLWRISYDDLFGECMIAMADSCRCYTTAKGTKFSTYLYNAANNRINAYIREQCRPYKINQNVNDKIIKVNRLINEKGASVEDAAKELGIPEDEVIMYLNHNKFAYSLDFVVENDKGDRVDIDEVVHYELDEEMTPEDIVKEIITNNKSMTKLEKELFCKSKGILGFTQTSKRQLAEDYNMQGKDIDKILRKAQWKFTETVKAQADLYGKSISE